MGMLYRFSSLHLKWGMNLPWWTRHFPWKIPAHVCVCARAHTCKSVFGREHRNGPSPGHRIWHLTIKHIKAREVERKQTQLLKNLQNTFCVVLSKNIFHIQLKLGAGLYVWGLHKASYIFSFNTQLGEASGLITSHDCVFFSCNIKFITCGSGSDVKLTGTTWSQLVSCFSSHWQGKGTRREASRAMSSLLGIPGKIRSESKKQTVPRKREQYFPQTSPTPANSPKMQLGISLNYLKAQLELKQRNK